jgi:D-threo-aldose 1-dehydrogenase
MEDTALLTTLVRKADVEVLMLPGRYTLLDESALDLPTPDESACTLQGDHG